MVKTVETTEKVELGKAETTKTEGGSVTAQVWQPQRPARAFKVPKMLLILIGVAVLAAAAWGAYQYKQHRDRYSPAKQAALFQKYDDESAQMRDLRRHSEEVAILEGYLATKPAEQYRNKATLKLGDALVNARRYDDAIKRYKEVESVPEHQLDAWRGLAKAYMGKRDRNQAANYLQRTVDKLKSKGDAESNLRAAIDQVQLDDAKR